MTLKPSQTQEIQLAELMLRLRELPFLAVD